jgi:hypothetical protein
MAGSRNVARPPPRAGSDPIDSFMHCCEHHRALVSAPAASYQISSLSGYRIDNPIRETPLV